MYHSNNMDIYLFEIPAIEIDTNKYLNKEELDIINNYHNKKTREKKKYGILLQKFVIKMKYNIPTENIKIKRTEYNKPYFNHYYQYNMSYSDKYIIIACAYNIKVGIDIQKEDIKVANVLTKYGNKGQIFNNNIEENTRLWTRIESYLKLIGYGLTKIGNIYILKNNNIIDKSSNKQFFHVDISDYLPDKIHGTICTTQKVKNININTINSKLILERLNE